MTVRWYGVICLLVVAGISCGADERRQTIPKEVQQAEQKLTKWLKGFDGQTTEKVRKTLGAPDKEDSWEFEEKQEPVLRYKVGDSTELSLFFHDGQVVKAGLHLLP